MIRLKGLVQGPPVSVKEITVKVIEQVNKVFSGCFLPDPWEVSIVLEWNPATFSLGADIYPENVFCLA